LHLHDDWSGKVDRDFQARSTSLLNCIGRFAGKRMAALDERFRLLTTSYVASVGGYRLSALLATCPHDFMPMIPYPNPVLGSGSAARKGFCKTNPNDSLVPNRKTSFSSWNMNVSIQSSFRDETFFYETNPNREKRESAPMDCKSDTYAKISWQRLTMPEAKRTQMRRLNPKTETVPAGMPALRRTSVVQVRAIRQLSAAAFGPRTFP